MRFDAPPPWELVLWDIIEQTGWTIEYVNGMDINDVYARSDILRARQHAKE